MILAILLFLFALAPLSALGVILSPPRSKAASPAAGASNVFSDTVDRLVADGRRASPVRSFHHSHHSHHSH
jgi:hypothetical protein